MPFQDKISHDDQSSYK